MSELDNMVGKVFTTPDGRKWRVCKAASGVGLIHPRNQSECKHDGLTYNYNPRICAQCGKWI